MLGKQFYLALLFFFFLLLEGFLKWKLFYLEGKQTQRFITAVQFHT